MKDLLAVRLERCVIFRRFVLSERRDPELNQRQSKKNHVRDSCERDRRSQSLHSNMHHLLHCGNTRYAGYDVVIIVVVVVVVVRDMIIGRSNNNCNHRWGSQLSVSVDVMTTQKRRCMHLVKTRHTLHRFEVWAHRSIQVPEVTHARCTEPSESSTPLWYPRFIPNHHTSFSICIYE